MESENSEKKVEGVEGLFSDLKSDGFIFKNADFGQIEAPESIKFTGLEQKEGESSNKRRIVKPRRNLKPSSGEKLTNSLNLLHIEDEDSKSPRTFVPTWKIILYLEQIVTHLEFELYPMDIFMEIRKIYHSLNSPVTAENAIVSTIELKSFSVLRSPSGLFIESENHKGLFKLLIAEYGKQVISRVSIDVLTQKVTSYEIVAGTPDIMGGIDGPALKAQFQQPISICKDWDDNLLIVDCAGHKIRKLDMKTGLVSTFAGSGINGLENGPLLEARFQHPSDICLYKDAIYIVDSGNSQIRMIEKKELKVKTLTFKSIEHDNNQGLSKPRSLCIGPNGDIFVTDFGNSKVKKLSRVIPGSDDAKEFGEEFEYKLSTVLRAQFKQPYGICLDNEGNIIVSDWESSNIRKLDISGARVKHTNIAGKISGYGDGKGGVETTRFQGPCGLKIDSIGNIYIADYLNHMIRKISNETLIPQTYTANLSSQLSIYYEQSLQHKYYSTVK